MSGAAALAGLGGLRGGAGLVELAVPASIQPIISMVEPSWLSERCRRIPRAESASPHGPSSRIAGPRCPQSRSAPD